MSHASVTSHQSDAHSFNMTLNTCSSQISLTGASPSAARRLQSSPQTHQQPDPALHGVADQCVTLYMNYLFPISPTIHEPSIRAMVPLLDGTVADGGEDMTALRSRTLLTSLCAVTALTLPASVFPMQEQIGHHFLTASQETLKLHQDYGW